VKPGTVVLVEYNGGTVYLGKVTDDQQVMFSKMPVGNLKNPLTIKKKSLELVPNDIQKVDWQYLISTVPSDMVRVELGTILPQDQAALLKYINECAEKYKETMDM
jgi:hypothetical protein